MNEYRGEEPDRRDWLLTQAASGMLGAAIGVFVQAALGRWELGVVLLGLGFGLACIVGLREHE